MQMEIRMSDREQERAGILMRLEQGQLTRGEAAGELGVGMRQLRRIWQRWQQQRLGGLVHRGRGRRSNRAHAPALRTRALALVARHYADFGPTAAREMLAQRHGLEVGLETLRRWMRAQGLQAGSRRAPRRRRLRPRRERSGELLQMDTSLHAWLEGRAAAQGEPVLIALIDDATSRLWARFYPADTSEANMDLLADYIARFGRPQALYTDRASHFVVNSGAAVGDGGARPLTQIGRALGQLRIGHIAAHSPQAKGRIERAFRTLQERLVRQLRLDNARTLQQANRCLHEQFLPWWNGTLTIAPARRAQAHRALLASQRLEVIFSRQETRQVMNDMTIQVETARWQLSAGKSGLRPGARVTVEWRRDGTRHVRYKNSYVKFAPTCGAARWGTAVGLRPPCVPQRASQTKTPPSS
jgi:transposase-like protein